MGLRTYTFHTVSGISLLMWFSLLGVSVGLKSEPTEIRSISQASFSEPFTSSRNAFLISSSGSILSSVFYTDYLSPSVYHESPPLVYIFCTTKHRAAIKSIFIELKPNLKEIVLSVFYVCNPCVSRLSSGYKLLKNPSN